jgi:hypothetical protein
VYIAGKKGSNLSESTAPVGCASGQGRKIIRDVTHIEHTEPNSLHTEPNSFRATPPALHWIIVFVEGPTRQAHGTPEPDKLT